MLSDIFTEKRCFKLVCGAGNEDAEEVEKLVTLYSLAGCNFFDLCAKLEIVDAAKSGLNRAGIKEDRYLCVSVGIKGDPHVSKYSINTDLCKKCGSCASVCPQKAIVEGANFYNIKPLKCIGCGRCTKICKHGCIEKYSETRDLKEVLPPITEKGIDCIEFHILGDNEAEIDEKWNDINNLYDGMLSICVDRAKLGNEQLINRLNKMLKDRKSYTTIIQADGAPMSGGEDNYKTTLQAVAAAEIVQKANLPVYILLSGGTNSKTSELASLCGINFGGVAIGSFARKIVKKYIDRADFYTNKEVFNSALEKAKELVNTTLKNIK